MNLSVDYSELDKAGLTVVNNNDEFRKLLAEIKSINESLAGVWQGQDASKYTNAVEEQAQTMQKLSDTIESIGNYMKKVSAAYKEAAENNANAIN